MASIGPYAATGVARPSLLSSLSANRATMDDLLRQLTTLKRSDTYAGLGDGASVSLAMRARLSAVDSYQSIGSTVGVRVNLMASALTRLEAIGAEYKLTDPNEFTLTSGAVTIAQSQASVDLKEAIAALNTDVGGRYLFSGRATDAKPVISADAMLADDGAKAGLRTVIAERKLADLGADGRGRIDVSAVSGSSFTVSEEASGPFGFKISSLTSTLADGVATGPTGTPPSITLGVTGAPKAGETVKVGLTLPDGSTEEITLTAKAASDPTPLAEGEFRIGATAEETAENMRTAFDAALTTRADTALVAASAMQAGEEFFNVAPGAEPARVAGFDGAYPDEASRIAALQNAGALDATSTAARTVSWYVGENAADDPRKTSAAKIDDGVSIAYGARANEDGPRKIVQNLAVFSSITFSAADPNAKARYSALATRTTAELASPETATSVKTMTVDLASATRAIAAAKTRHDATQDVAQNAISKVEDVNKEDVALKILELQTRLQASYQATAALRSLSLVNFI